MFRCSVDQGGRGTQIFALLIRTVVVYYKQVLQVRIEGTELQYLCVVYYNRAYQQDKSLSAAASLIHGTPEHARTMLEPT